MARTQTRLGKKFGRLTVVERLDCDNRWKNYNYSCECDCGNTKVAKWKNLASGGTKSCGCLAKEVMEGLLASGIKTRAAKEERRTIRAATQKHSKHPLYNTWRKMKERCNNQNSENYKFYGAKGVSVCQEWSDDFLTFAKDMGERPKKHSLDRINPAGNYEPSNCRWADKIVQAENQRIPKKVIMAIMNGKTETVAAFCKKLNIDVDKTILEIKNGRTAEQAISVVWERKKVWTMKGNTATPKDYEAATLKALTR